MRAKWQAPRNFGEIEWTWPDHQITFHRGNTTLIYKNPCGLPCDKDIANGQTCKRPCTDVNHQAKDNRTVTHCCLPRTGKVHDIEKCHEIHDEMQAPQAPSHALWAGAAP